MKQTAKELIEYVDELRPNVFTNPVKLRWINELESEIQSKIFLIAPKDIVTYRWVDNFSALKTYQAGDMCLHDGLQWVAKGTTGGSWDENSWKLAEPQNHQNVSLLIEEPNSEIYENWLKWKIDIALEEYETAQAELDTYNAAWIGLMGWASRHIDPGCGEAERMLYYISAYGIAVKHGYAGTEDEWLASLIGPRGPTGAAIVSTQKVGVDADGGNIYEQTFDDGQTARFTAPKGVKGDNGKSAYQTAVDGGYTGTEQEFTQALTEVEDKYTKPSGGIPKSDLNAFVQTAVDKADTALQPADLDELEIRISDVEGKIPDQASSINKLADKNFVNSSIGTNTANYISNNGQPFTSVAQLEAYSGTVTNNDYAFVTGTDEAGNTYFDRYKATVSGTTVSWAKEYRLNNSSFTAAQWAAIQSGITGAMVVKLSGIEAHAQVNAIDGGATLPTATEDMLGKFFIVTTPLTDGDVQYNYLYQCRQTANGYEWDRVYTQYVDKKPVAETFSIQSENWVRPGVAPFGFICPRSTSHTIGADTVVELINNNAVNFAKFGIAIISAGNGFVTFGAVNKPDATVNLEVNYYG